MDSKGSYAWIWISEDGGMDGCLLVMEGADDQLRGKKEGRLQIQRKVFALITTKTFVLSRRCPRLPSFFLQGPMELHCFRCVKFFSTKGSLKMHVSINIYKLYHSLIQCYGSMTFLCVYLSGSVDPCIRLVFAWLKKDPDPYLWLLDSYLYIGGLKTYGSGYLWLRRYQVPGGPITCGSVDSDPQHWLICIRESPTLFQLYTLSGEDMTRDRLY